MSEQIEVLNHRGKSLTTKRAWKKQFSRMEKITGQAPIRRRQCLLSRAACKTATTMTEWFASRTS
jgi:hypothetical protein